MQHANDVEIGFNLYELNRRPSSSPTTTTGNKKTKGKQSTCPPAAPAHATTNGSGSTSSTRLGATPPPRRPQGQKPKGTVRAGSTQRTSLPSAKRDGVAARSPSGTSKTAISRVPKLPAGQRSSITSRPCQSSATGVGELEQQLRNLLSVTEQLLDEDVVQLISSTLRTLQQARKLRKGARPVAASGVARRTSHGGPQKCDRASVADCLVRACEATSPQQRQHILCSFYDSHLLPRAATPPPPFTCLIGAAMAELVLAHTTAPTRGAAPLGDSSATALVASPPSTDSKARQAQALEALDHAVAAGHVGAMLRVGICLRDRVGGITASLPAAVTWIERAATTGYAPAMHEMGTLYEGGLCVGQDVLDEDWGAALMWYRRAAEKGHRASQLDLGKLLLMAESEAVACAEDMGGSDNDRTTLKAQAMEWLESAAAAGDQEAIRLLQRLS